MEDAAKIVTAAGKNRLSLAALALLVIGVVAVVYMRTSPGLSQTVGTDSVVMGQVQPDARIGDRSVVIGPTDTHGNIILNQPMIVGHNAHGGPGDLVIGADAGSTGQPPKAEPPQNTTNRQPGHLRIRRLLSPSSTLSSLHFARRWRNAIAVHPSRPTRL